MERFVDLVMLFFLLCRIFLFVYSSSFNSLLGGRTYILMTKLQKTLDFSSIIEVVVKVSWDWGRDRQSFSLGWTLIQYTGLQGSAIKKKSFSNIIHLG